MVHLCIVYGCVRTTPKNPLVSFHTFPRKDLQPRRHAAWVKFVRRTRKWHGPYLASIICSQHFEKDMFKNYLQVENGYAKNLRLCDNAVPTIYPEGTCSTLARTGRITSREQPADQLYRTAYRKREANRIVNAGILTAPHVARFETVFTTDMPVDTSTRDLAAECNREITTCTATCQGTGNIHRGVSTNEDSSQTGHDPCKCSRCNNSFNVHFNIKSEQRECGEKRYGCGLCGEMFLDSQSTKIHFFQQHAWNDESPSFHKDGDLPAPIISFPSFDGGTSASNNSIRRTDHTYSQENTDKEVIVIPCVEEPRVCNKTQHTCDICEKKFAQKSYLLLHRMRHFRDKSFTCRLCGAKFTRKLVLTAHVEKHARERPYSCNMCSNSFSSYLNLSRHRTTCIADGEACNIFFDALTEGDYTYCR